MSLQAILDAIYASGEEQLREIEAHTEAQVSEILAQAQKEGRRAGRAAHKSFWCDRGERPIDTLVYAEKTTAIKEESCSPKRSF